MVSGHRLWSAAWPLSAVPAHPRQLPSFTTIAASMCSNDQGGGKRRLIFCLYHRQQSRQRFGANGFALTPDAVFPGKATGRSSRQWRESTPLCPPHASRGTKVPARPQQPTARRPQGRRNRPVIAINAGRTELGLPAGSIVRILSH
jgi:hypothetical protein